MEEERPLLYGCQERTFPYFDRDLLEFLHAIPRTQLIRVGQRRSLMRRALAGLVPYEVLWRKNKAISARVLMRALEDVISLYWNRVDDALAIRLGYFNPSCSKQAFEAMQCGQLEALGVVRKFAVLELWLAHFKKIQFKNLDIRDSSLIKLELRSKRSLCGNGS